MHPDIDKIPRGSFSNYFEVGCNEEEIIVRFGLKYEDHATPSVLYTFITTPRYARKLWSLLDQTLRDHEALIARIREGSESDPQ